MILTNEVDLHPADLFNDFPIDDGRLWWLAHTRPRQEKAVCRDLLEIGLSYYLPCMPRRVLIRKQVVISQIPLFSGYAFVRITEDERVRVYAGRRVASLSRIKDQELFWKDLWRVRKVLDLGEPVTPENNLVPGMQVAIRSGPLAGLSGTIVRSAGGHKFVVSVNLIQRGVSVTVDLATLGVLEQAA